MVSLRLILPYLVVESKTILPLVVSLSSLTTEKWGRYPTFNWAIINFSWLLMQPLDSFASITWQYFSATSGHRSHQVKSVCCSITAVYRPSMEWPPYSALQHITPWLCHLARSRHLFCCQRLVSICDSHYFFILNHRHQLIGPHFRSKSCGEWVDIVSSMALVGYFRRQIYNN